jgi:hypothetical protein
MVGKFGVGDVFTAIKKKHEISYHSNEIDESTNNEAKVTKKLLNIVKTF